MLKSGKDATYAEVKIDLGHDSFLIDSEELYALIHEFLNS
jgi:homoserine O-acetyltransferase